MNIFKSYNGFANWCWNRLDIMMNDDEARTLLSYFECHGYRLGVVNDKLYRIDALESSEPEEYSLLEAVLAACEWNDEFIQDAENSEEASVDTSSLLTCAGRLNCLLGKCYTRYLKTHKI